MAICATVGCENEGEKYIIIEGKSLFLCPECASRFKEENPSNTMVEVREKLKSIEDRMNIMDKYIKDSSSNKVGNKSKGFVKYGEKE